MKTSVTRIVSAVLAKNRIDTSETEMLQREGVSPYLSPSIRPRSSESPRMRPMQE